MKVMRRLVDTRRLRSTVATFDLWLEARAALDSRWLRGSWVRPHLIQDECVAQFSADTLWAFVANKAADEAAGSVGRWLDKQYVLGMWVSIRRILQVPAHPRRQGSTPATRREFLGVLPLIFPQYSWQLGVAGSLSWCVCCGLGLWIKNLVEDWPSGLVIVRRAIGKILECIPVMTSFSRPGGGGCGPVVPVVSGRSPIVELVPGCD